MENTINITNLHTLFLYLGNATMSIPAEHRDRVFKDMAFKLHEWANIPISKLRDALGNFDVEFHNRCDYCGEEMIDAPDDQIFCSYACRVKDCGCKGVPSCCGGY